MITTSTWCLLSTLDPIRAESVLDSFDPNSMVDRSTRLTQKESLIGNRESGLTILVYLSPCLGDVSLVRRSDILFHNGFWLGHSLQDVAHPSSTPDAQNHQSRSANSFPSVPFI